MLRVAIIGCGKIADSHAAQILRIQNCEIVAVCDREPLMTRQLADRFPVQACFSDVAEMLKTAKPEVVHITTPPESHFSLGKMCLEAGCHVYVEKPFTLFEDEARQLIEMAESRGLKITAGHDDQFSHVARRLRATVASGYLGDRPVHMESYYGYELGTTGYAGALLGDKRHWVRRLPGKLLHNIISHGIARIAEYLSGDCPQVVAVGFQSPFLKRLGENELIDELRVIIREEAGTTAYFTFSSQMRPSVHQFRIFGSKNALFLDQDQETLIKMPGKALVSYSEKFIPPVRFAKQYMDNLATNFGIFWKRDFHMKSGMKYLIEAFYASITDGKPVPIPYREIILTARIMDAIFAQLDASAAGESGSPAAMRVGETIGAV